MNWQAALQADPAGLSAWNQLLLDASQAAVEYRQICLDILNFELVNWLWARAVACGGVRLPHGQPRIAHSRGSGVSRHMLHGGATRRLNRGLPTKQPGTLLPTKPDVHDGCLGINFRMIYWARQLETLGVQPRWYARKLRHLVGGCLQSCNIRVMAAF
jgi:hypothetical protein